MGVSGRDADGSPGSLLLTWTPTNGHCWDSLKSLLLLLGFQSPGEIKRREVSRTVTKKLDFHLRVLARSRGGRWSWTLKRAQERSRAGRWSWTPKVRLLLLQSLLSSSATDIVLVTLLRATVETAIA